MSDRFLRQHLAYYAARANPIALAEQRGSQTISHRQARKRGYRVPLELQAPDHPLGGLLFIVHRPDGSTSEQLRLDVPIPDPDKSGKTHRYLNLPGKPAKGIDVHPSNLARLADLSIPRVLTEGVAHVDAITGVGWLGIGVTGVWMAVVKRADGTYELHPTVKQACPPGSIVFMGFDPDQMTKRQVHDALRVTSSLLRDHGCLVLYLHVPATFNGQPVDGVDTYFVAGGTMAALIAGATAELPRLEGGDGAATCNCDDCPERDLRKLLQRERVERAQLHAVPNLDPAKKLLGERMWSDLRFATSRGLAYQPTNKYFMLTTGLGAGVIKNHIGSVRDALGVKVESRTYPPGYRFPSGKVAQNHVTERTCVPPPDILERDLVKSLKVLVRADEKRGGPRPATLTVDACELHPDSHGEILRTVVCKKGREPLARLKPITVALRRPLAPEGAKFDPSEDAAPLPLAPSPFRRLHTSGGAKFDPSGQVDQGGQIYQRARERMAAQQAPPISPDDPLAQLEADPIFQQLDFASKNRLREQARVGVAS